MINGYSELTTKFNSAKGKENLFVDQIVAGYAVEGMDNADNSAAYVKNNMSGKQYLALKQRAWNRLVEYYNSLTK